MIKHLLTGNWKALGFSVFGAIWRLIVVLAAIVPATVLGDRPGHVGQNEKPWAVQSQWASAVAWVTLIPAAIWHLGTRINPTLLWLDIPIAIAASFWLSRRLSAHQGEEMAFRQWLSDLGALIGDPPRERNVDDQEAAERGPINWWRALTLVGAAVMAVSIALALSPDWVYVLPAGARAVTGVAEYYPAVLLIGYWIALIPSAVSGWRHGQLQSSESNTRLVWEPQIQAVLGVTRQMWEENQCRIQWSAAQDELTVTPVPPAARLKLDGLPSRVEVILPGWSVKAFSSEAVILVTLNNDAAEAASRQFRARSNGMVTGIEQTGGPTSRWILNPDRKPDPAALDAFARTVGLRLISCDEYRYSATAGKLSPETERVRDGLAALLRCAPHDLDVRLTEANNQTNEVQILRYPPVLDAEKRIATYLTAIRQLIPITNAFWHVDDSPATGSMTLTRRIDTIAGVQAYPWNAPVSHTAIPFARDTAGEVVSLGLLETNQLLGGLPGAGKSGGLTALLAGISRLENVALVGLDPKRVELAPWGARFTRISKTDDYASALLESLVEEMDRRYEWLEDRGLKKFTPADLTKLHPLVVVVIDELADLVSVGVTREEKDAELQRSTSVRRLIAKGRAAAIVVLTATQKPQSDVIPTSLRDLIQQRVSFSTTNVEMTDTILGSGMGRNGGLAHEIEASAKGVCFIVNESSRVPVRARAFWIPDDEVQGLAERTAHLRVELPWLPPAPVRTKPTPGFVIEPEPEIETVGEFEFTLDDLDDSEPIAELKPAPVVAGFEF